MFGLFKKKDEAGAGIATVDTLERHYPKEVIEIHKSFQMAGDELLKEAKAILTSANLSKKSKVDLLQELGFTNCPEVTDFTTELRKYNNAEEISKAIMTYRTKYPAHNFITEDQVQKICSKWNLVFAPGELYKGFFPEKNLKELKTFSDKYHDKNTLVLRGVRGGRGIPNTILLKDAVVGQRGSYFHIWKKGSKFGLYDNYAFQSNFGDDWYSSDRDNIFGLQHLGDLRFKVSKNPFSICAPLKDMNTEGRYVSGYKLEKHYPDPVVLYPVEHGYIIVTCWGDEASDPIITAPQN